MVKLPEALILLDLRKNFNCKEKWKSKGFSHTVFAMCDNVEKPDVEKYKYVVKLLKFFSAFKSTDKSEFIRIFKVCADGNAVCKA